MLYLIGLGLNTEGISLEGSKAMKKCKKVYLEGYTVDFPYSIEDISKSFNTKIELLDRNEVESERLIKEAKKEDIALLIYGCPLFATTHMTIIEDAKKFKVKYTVIYAASVFDAIAESGLQLYKFGKIASMPKWQKSFEPDSFLEIVEENRSIGAHSLILIDIGLDIEEAISQLKKSLDNREGMLKVNELIICESLGTTKSKFSYGKLKNFKKVKVNKPYCIIIPGNLHFLEKEVIESYKSF